MEHCAAHGLRVADQRRKREDPRAARAEDRRRGQTEAREQRGRVIGLLLGEVAVQPAGLGLCPLPRRSYVTTVNSSASRPASVSKWPPSPVDPINSTGGPAPRVS